MTFRIQPGWSRRAAATRWRAGALVALLLAGCGGGEFLRRGDDALGAGRYDDAIGAYDQALRQSGGSGTVAVAARERLQQARTSAARDAVRQGKVALEANNLERAGDHYRRARAYAPTEPEVVTALAALLTLRTNIEAQIAATTSELAALRAAGDACDIPAYRRSASRARTLREWRRDYPAVDGLWQQARVGFARRLLAEARRQAEARAFADAGALLDEALRYDADLAEAATLRDRMLAAGDADGLVAQGREALSRGDLDGALRHFGAALEQVPQHAEARAGRSEARRAFVASHLSAAASAAKARKRRDALLLLRQAMEVGTDDDALQAKLEKTSQAAHAAAARTFVELGQRQDKRGHFGAALLSYRVAVAIGGADAAGARLSAALAKVDAARTYRLVIEPIRLPREQRGGGLSEALLARLRARFEAVALGQAGVTLALERGAKADGSLVFDAPRFDVVRQSRPDVRSKKILDRVEFTPNPAWAAAQSALSTALPSLNAATDVLRPLERQANEAETRLAEYDRKLAEIQAQVHKENVEHYQQAKSPCADGSLRCPETYGARRWAKQIAWYDKKSRQEGERLAALAPQLEAARARQREAQRRFDDAERVARETPAKLRQEIWKSHSYEVTSHEIRVDIDASLAWRDRITGAELARGEHRITELRVDYSTPELSERNQLVEAERKSGLPDDEALQRELIGKLLDTLGEQIQPALLQHGSRFVRSAEAARSDDERLHYQVLALSVGRSLDDATRGRIAQALLERMGYDWTQIAVDLSRIPY